MGINNFIIWLKNIGIIFKWKSKFFYFNCFFLIILFDFVVYENWLYLYFVICLIINIVKYKYG